LLPRSSIGGMFTHRTATPGRTGSNDGAGVDVTMSFYQNVRLDAYLAGTRTEGRDGDNLSYRGFFDYNADRLGVQVERLVVEPNFLPEIGFVRRTDMRRNFTQARIGAAHEADLGEEIRLRAPHRYAAQFHAGALQLQTDLDTQPPEDHTAGELQLREIAPH